MQNGPDENIDISDFVDIGKQIQQDKRIPSLINEVVAELKNLKQGDPDFKISNQLIADLTVTKLVDLKMTEQQLKDLVDITHPAILNMLDKVDKDQAKAPGSEDSMVNIENAKWAAKVALGVTVGAAGFFYGGPMCMYAMQAIFPTAYTLLVGAPSTLGYYTTFLPLQSHAMVAAYNYGPTALAAVLPYVADKAGDGVEYVAKGAAGLATNALSGAAAYAMSMFYSKKPVENAQKAITDESEKSDTPTPKPK